MADALDCKRCRGLCSASSVFESMGPVEGASDDCMVDADVDRVMGLESTGDCDPLSILSDDTCEGDCEGAVKDCKELLSLSRKEEDGPCIKYRFRS